MPSNGRVLIFTENPGLIHIGWEIFRHMKLRHLLKSRLVCRSWKSVVDDPHFWLKAYKKTRSDVIFPPKWKDLLELLEAKDQLVKEAKLALCLFKIFKHNDAIQRNQLYNQNSKTRRPKKIKLEDPLHIVSEIGAPSLVQFILKHNLCTFQQDDAGKTPLHSAAQRGHAAVVKILVPFTTNPNVGDSSKWTALHSAAYNGFVDVVIILASCVDDASPKDVSGWTPIYCAALNGHVDVVNVLISCVSNPMEKDSFGITPLEKAVENGNAEIVKLLATDHQYLNTPNANGKTLFQIAKNSDVLQTLRTLSMMSAADLKPKRNSGKLAKLLTQHADPLDGVIFAAKIGQDSVVKYLLKHNNIELTHNFTGLTPFQVVSFILHKFAIFFPLTLLLFFRHDI